MTGFLPGDERLSRFTRFLQWSSLTSGGRVTHVHEIDEHSLTWTGPTGTTYRTDLASGASQPTSTSPIPETARIVRPPDAEGLPPVHEARSPDASQYVTELDDDLAIRDAGDGALRRLTDSGTPNRPWRVNAQVTTLVPTPPVWAPDGRSVFSVQADISRIPEYPLVDWMSFAITVDVARLPSERSGTATFTAAFVEVESGLVTRTELAADDRTLIPLHWTKDGSAFLALLASGNGLIDLVRIDAATGHVQSITHDMTPVLMPYLGPLLSAALAPLLGEEQIGWLSDADGDLRLYAVDLDTGFRTPLTPPGVQVARVIGVDAHKRVVLLARTDQQRPYDVHVCRTDIAGEFTVLTREPGTHEAILVPDGDGFVDSHSALTRPPRSELRGLDGELRAVIDVADTQASDALERAEPREFRVKAADGRTDLYGVLYLPPDFDPRKRYPVIESIYGGPQAITIANAWADPLPPSGTPSTGFSTIAQAFAQLGYIGVVLDARGTPGRGRDFQAAAADGFGSLGVRDHVAALRELAERHPWLDAQRRGVIGISFGGYFAARCGLLAPDVYQAVVAAAGPYDLELAAPYWLEALLGVSFHDNPEAFADAGIVQHAADFRPELLLIHGTRDSNVPLATTMRLSDALVRAGKHHDLLLLQNQCHQLRGEHAEFALVEAARFFQRHLRPQP